MTALCCAAALLFTAAVACAQDAPPPDHTESQAVAGAGADDVSLPQQVDFQAADGVRVFADFYPGAGEGSKALLLLFHQAGSNAAEYTPIATRLAAEGFDCLAVDQRSGGTAWRRNNRTVMALGKSDDFLAAYSDMEAALAWAAAREGHGKLVVWGSSYSASLVFRLAAEHDEVAAVLAFSPGALIDMHQPERGWAARTKAPVFVTSGPGVEQATADFVFSAVAATDKTHYVARDGVHGSSTLRADRNPAGWEDNWEPVLSFLDRVTK